MDAETDGVTDRNDEEDEEYAGDTLAANQFKIDKDSSNNYKSWLYYSKVLYDYILVHLTEWPSYVAEWYFGDSFPLRSHIGETYSYAILSTYSSMC